MTIKELHWQMLNGTTNQDLNSLPKDAETSSA
jgi:hypothetical protein